MALISTSFTYWQFCSWYISFYFSETLG